MKAQWIYFDVPYAEGANTMRALLGYTNSENKISVLITDCKDIPSALGNLEENAKAKKISLEKDLTLVYPHDMRHGLAWAVKEPADKKGWNFSRHIPYGQYPEAEQLILYAFFDDGSDEKNLDKTSARKKVIDLNSEATEEFSNGDMLPVMGFLRHALKLSVMHFGWTGPLTVYSLINLISAFKATGNSENEYEGKFLVMQLLHAFMISPPSSADWNGSLDFFERLASQMESLGSDELAVGVRSLPVFILH